MVIESFDRLFRESELRQQLRLPADDRRKKIVAKDAAFTNSVRFLDIPERGKWGPEPRMAARSQNERTHRGIFFAGRQCFGMGSIRGRQCFSRAPQAKIDVRQHVSRK